MLCFRPDYVSSELEKGSLLGAWDSLVYWGELSEDYKSINRNQSDHVMVKLHALGLSTQPKGGPKPIADFDLFLEKHPEMVERLAQAEHRRWNADRWIAGWNYGRVRNNKLRLPPSIVPWNQLSDAEKQKDVDTIYSIPSQLALIGEEICEGTFIDFQSGGPEQEAAAEGLGDHDPRQSSSSPAT